MMHVHLIGLFTFINNYKFFNYWLIALDIIKPYVLTRLFILKENFVRLMI